MDFRHINVCNTSVGITVQKYKFFTKENDTISTQNIFLAANIPSNLMFAVLQNTRIQTRGPNAGGGMFSRYYIPDTATQAYFVFLFYLLINQIYIPHTNVV